VKMILGDESKRRVSIFRDSWPVKAPTRLTVDQYGPRRAQVVASAPAFDTPKYQQFLVAPGPVGDRLLAALKEGPVKPVLRGATGTSIWTESKGDRSGRIENAGETGPSWLVGSGSPR
jgi:hypothetical protein